MTLYIIAVSRAIKFHRVSRKCYVLLLNRAIGDILACCVGVIIVSYVLSVEIIKYVDFLKYNIIIILKNNNN